MELYLTQGQKDDAKIWLDRAKVAKNVEKEAQLYITFFETLLAYLNGGLKAKQQLAQALNNNPRLDLNWDWSDLEQAFGKGLYPLKQEKGMKKLIQMMKDYQAKNNPPKPG